MTLQESSGPSESVFGLVPGALKDEPLRNLQGNAEYERLEALDQPGNETEYEASLAEALDQVSADDPLRGYILANLGTLALKDGRSTAALETFAKVAKGHVPSAAAHRLMSMRRYAWCAHKLGDRLTAYKAYDEIEEQTTDEAVLATCRVEKQGLLFELAESGKGSHEEVRQSLSEAWKSTPAALGTPRATLELMFLETYARQPKPDFKKAAILSEAFVERWNQAEDKPLREIGAAMFQAGMNWRKAGNEEKALYWAERTLNDIPTTAPRFAGFDPHAQALVGISKLLPGEENKQRRDQIRRDVIEWYPADEITTKIKELDPGLINRVRPSASKPQ